MKKKHKIKETIVAVVLDQSGSMQSCKDQTISGFNEYVDSLKKIKGKVSLGLTKFNGSEIKISAPVEISKANKLDSETYVPHDVTPLYDAIGKTINNISAADKGKSVLVVILTDGQENASREYSRQAIFDLIKEKTKNKWTFVYLGANQDAWAAGSAMGMQAGNIVNYDTKNMKNVFRSIATGTVSYCASVSSDVSPKEFFTEKELREGLTK